MSGWLGELRALNRNLVDLVEVLRDLRAMLAPLLGWKVRDG